MKVLWLCNVCISAVSAASGLKGSPGGGWLEGALNALKDQAGLEIVYCFPQSDAKRLVCGKAGGLDYCGFYSRRSSGKRDIRLLEDTFRAVLKLYSPDIVHIHGTEAVHSYAMARAFNRPGRTIVSIQGMVSVYAKYYPVATPNIMHSLTFHDLVRLDSLYLQMRRMRKRGYYEKKLIGSTGHIIGRTDWDRACTEQINPSAAYHHCNETLRDAFYSTEKWSFERCERHSIFVSSSFPSYKCFHHVLEAMPHILSRYPDAKVHVTGPDVNRIPWYRISSYARYVKKLIRELGLKDKVHFWGALSAGEMADMYKRANVYVLPSAIENSPNSLGEAMMIGTPIVAADVGGVKNFLEHERQGYIYQQTAPYMIAHYVNKLFGSEDTANTMSAVARQKARGIFDPQVNRRTLMDIYALVLAKGQGESALSGDVL